MRRRTTVTQAGLNKLLACADADVLLEQDALWSGPPNPGTLYAIARITGFSLNGIHRMKNGLPISTSTAQKMIDMFGVDAVEVREAE